MIRPDGHEVSPGKLAGFVAGLAEGAKDFAVLVEFDDAIVSSIDHPNVLVRGDLQTVRVTVAVPLLDEFAVGVKDLDTLILAIPDVDAALIVDGDAVRQIKFAGAGSELSPRLEIIAIAIKLYDARIAVTIGHVNVAVPGEGHVGGLVEQPVCFCAGVDSAENQQDVAGGIEFEDEMVAIVCGPEVIIWVDTQAVGVGEQSVTQTLNEVALRIEFGEHWLGALEQVDVSLGIYGDGGGFSGNCSFGEFEKVWEDAVGKFGNGLELAGGRKRLLCGGEWQERD